MPRKGTPTNAVPPETVARRLAFDVLKAVRVDGAFANLELASQLKQARLSGRDAAFATELVAGTLRGRGSYDAILGACVARSLQRVDPDALDVLRLGAHQLLALHLPHHAAINTSVDLARSVVGEKVTGFVNAVLRQVAVKQLDVWLRRIAPRREADPLGHLAIVHSHPKWVVEQLHRALGDLEGTDELEALLVANNQPPKVTLVARPGRSTREELPGEPTAYSPYGVTLSGGNPSDIAAVA
ncbi:MAG: transcription antitermination factor NusB, partial [Nocardioides sp.]